MSLFKKLTVLFVFFLNGLFSQVTVELLTNETKSNTSDKDHGVLNTYYHDYKLQYLYLASDLTAAGILSGATISQMGIEVYESPGMYLKNFRIAYSTTSLNTLGSSFVSTTVVFNPKDYQSSDFIPESWKMFLLDVPITWNGTDNLIIEFSIDGDQYLRAGGVVTRLVGSNRSLAGLHDSGAGSYPFSSGMWGMVDLNHVPALKITHNGPGIVVEPAAGISTTEAGASATFSVKLNSAPTDDVTIGLSSSDPTEGTPDLTSLTFTPSNYATSQTVTVNPQDDLIDDDNVAYEIVTAPATSSDATYNGLNGDDITVINNDDDTAEITAVPVSGLETNENGSTASFQVALVTEPTNTVTVNITSTNTNEGTVSPTSLSFLTDNWNISQTVTITGQDDNATDGNASFYIKLQGSSSDSKYDNLNGPNISVTNLDNDVPGISVSATSGLSTTEGGGTANFTAMLNTQPSANVSLTISTSDATEGSLSPGILNFTTTNWNTAQAVTITGVDDNIDDGDVDYTITGTTSSADTDYNSISMPNVSIANSDDDTKGISVSTAGTLITSESGNSATFTVVLDSEPTHDVSIGITSNDNTEGIVSVGTLTFTNLNWNTAQTVEITGVDDHAVDGDITYAAITNAATSSDANYQNLDPANVSVINADDDVIGFEITPTSGLTSTEAGGTATFTVMMSSQPSESVSLPISSSDETEGRVAPQSVTFSTTNFNTAQSITITGVDDLIWDGDVDYSIVLGPSTSVDTDYNGVDPLDLSVINNDDEVPGLILNPTSGVATGENGATDKFTVMLNFQPSNDVNVTLACSDATECTVSPSSLTFTSTNWNTTQTVNVSGIDDDVSDGDISYQITTTTTSDDPNFDGVIQSISGTNLDDDIVGITVSGLSDSTTSETGAKSTFELVLESEPTSDVQIAIFSSDLTEASVAPVVLIFSLSNWDQPRTVTVSGLDDKIVDPDEAYEVVIWPAVSTDASYNGIDAPNLSLTNADDDVAGVKLTPLSGLSTTEMGGSDTLTVNLTAKPDANVNVAITSGDESEGTVFPSSLTFTSSDWDTSQQVIITGVDDDLGDGDIVYNIVAESSSTDSEFNALSDVKASVTNINDDPPGISIDPVGGLETTETGGTATFKVVLLSGPSDDVSFNLSTSNPAEGEISDSTVIFTTTNWSTEQTVTVSGLDDNIDDGDIDYTVVSGKSISSDPNYNDLALANVQIINIDDDSTGFDLSAISDSITTESGGSATFTVSLLSQPIVGVIVSITSSDTTEGVVVPESIVFTDKNWSTEQTVTVSGLDDKIDDGDIDYTIEISSSSNDPNYSVLKDTSISFANSDDDQAGLTISGKSGLVTTEAGEDTSITIMLNSEPMSDVFIVLTSSDSSEGLPDSDSLRFTPSTWDTKQNLKIVGQHDDLDDGDVAYNITGVSRSIDQKYNSLDIFILSATNIDNDSAAVNVTLLSQPITNEDSLSALLTIGLNSEPTADVTITVSSSDESEGKIIPKSFTFTSSDWAADTITVTGQKDFVDDGDVEYTVVTSAAVSEDINYSGLDPPDFTLTNLVMLFEVSRTSLDFKEVRRDSSKTLSIPITNRGTNTLVVSDINFTNNYFFSDDSTLEIAPSQTYYLNVTFNPVTLGDYLDTLELPFNLNLRENPRISLKGKSVKPTIFSSTTDLDFGLVLLSEPRMLSFDVINTGTDTLIVDSLVSSLPNFTTMPNEPTNVIPGDTLRARVILMTENGGPINDTLKLHSNDPDRPELSIPMVGVALTYPYALYTHNSIGLTTSLGTDISIEQRIINDGDYTMEYFLSVDDSSSAWLSVNPNSGSVAGHDTLNMIISVTNTENIGMGVRSGLLFITSNTGQNLTEETDSILIDLKVLAASSNIVSSSTLIPAGDSAPVTLNDNQGNPLHLSLDFSSGDGGLVTATYYPTSPITDSHTSFNDPDNIVTKPIFGNLYWEIVSDLSGVDSVDITFALQGLTGVQNFNKLRIGRRLEHSGKYMSWNLTPVGHTIYDEPNRTITAVNQTELSQWSIITDSSHNTFIDNNSPVLTSFTYSPNPPSVGEDLQLRISLEDESAIEGAILNYLVGGDNVFSSSSMYSVGSNNYETLINRFDISSMGVSFFVTATDFAGHSTVSDTLSPAIQFPENVLKSESMWSVYKQGIPKSKWRLLSIPAELDNSSTQSIFADDLGGNSSNKTWRVLEASNLEWIDAIRIESGKGYWIYQQVKKNPIIRTGSGQTSDFNGTVLQLEPGWNTIGSPYAFPVNVIVDTETFYGPISYGIADYEGWTDVESQLKPWAGYAVFNRADFSRPFPIEPFTAGVQLARGLPDSSNGWELNFYAKGKTYSDMTNIIGRREEATEYLDVFDNPEPPFLENYLSVSMISPDKDEKLIKYTSDIRSLEQRNGVWNLEIHAKGEKGPIAISYNLSESFPDRNDIVLLDMTTRDQYNLKEDQSFEIREYSEDFPYRLKIFAGSPEFVASAIAEVLSLLPEAFALRQNYPNPFNPATTIEFTLPKPQEISLVIYNLMGQEVRTLKRGMVDMGKHAIKWYGKDNLGQGVSSGVYFVRIYSPEFSASHKMVLMK